MPTNQLHATPAAILGCVDTKMLPQSQVLIGKKRTYKHKGESNERGKRTENYWLSGAAVRPAYFPPAQVTASRLKTGFLSTFF